MLALARRGAGESQSARGFAVARPWCPISGRTPGARRDCPPRVGATDSSVTRAAAPVPSPSAARRLAEPRHHPGSENLQRRKRCHVATVTLSLPSHACCAFRRLTASQPSTPGTCRWCRRTTTATRRGGWRGTPCTWSSRCGWPRGIRRPRRPDGHGIEVAAFAEPGTGARGAGAAHPGAGRRPLSTRRSGTHSPIRRSPSTVWSPTRRSRRTAWSSLPAGRPTRGSTPASPAPISTPPCSARPTPPASASRRPAPSWWIPAGAHPDDRVFVINIWGQMLDSVNYSNALAINGRSFPWDETMTATVGDTVRWRWINASWRPHPMHLHGFFFRVDSKGDGFRDTTYTAAQRRLAVTETMGIWQTMNIVWSPDRPGNWLFHCHIGFHATPYAKLDPPDGRRPRVPFRRGGAAHGGPGAGHFGADPAGLAGKRQRGGPPNPDVRAGRPAEGARRPRHGIRHPAGRAGRRRRIRWRFPARRWSSPGDSRPR